MKRGGEFCNSHHTFWGQQAGLILGLSSYSTSSNHYFPGMLRTILLSEMVFRATAEDTLVLIGVVVGIPLGLALGFYLIVRHVNRQFDRRPAVEQNDLYKDETLVQ
jgi:hypothetical protein